MKKLTLLCLVAVCLQANADTGKSQLTAADKAELSTAQAFCNLDAQSFIALANLQRKKSDISARLEKLYPNGEVKNDSIDFRPYLEQLNQPMSDAVFGMEGAASSLRIASACFDIALKKIPDA